MTPEIHTSSASARASASLNVEAQVRRQWEATRLTLIGILLGVSVAIGFGVESITGEVAVPFITTLLATALSFALLAAMFRSQTCRRHLLDLADWVLKP